MTGTGVVPTPAAPAPTREIASSIGQAVHGTSGLLAAGYLAGVPEISIVVPTLDRPRHLAATLAGLEAACVGLDAEVLVVADASEPDPSRVAAEVSRRNLDARCIAAPRRGASAARNIGWRSAHSPLILFLDDDLVASAELVAAHLAAHRREPVETIGVLGHVRWAPRLKVTPLMRWVEHGIQFDYPGIKGSTAGWGRFYTTNVSVKRSVLEQVDGFDEERFPFMYEDLDLGYRLHQKLGFVLLYERRAVGDHLQAMDLDFWRRRVRKIAVAERAFCRVHPEIEPFFHRLFSDAHARPPARGRGRHLIGLVAPSVPVLGEYVWSSAHLYFAQALAPDFLEAWAAEGGQGADRLKGGDDSAQREQRFA